MQAPTVHILIDDDSIPRTINKQIKVHMIAEKHIVGKISIEDIAEYYGITLADVHSALAYYYDNHEFYQERELKLQPLIEDAKLYTAELNKKIEARLAAKKSED